MRMTPYSSAIIAAFFHPPPPPFFSTSILPCSKVTHSKMTIRSMVHLHGTTTTSTSTTTTRRNNKSIKTSTTALKMKETQQQTTNVNGVNGNKKESNDNDDGRPMNPELLSSPEYVQECAAKLASWLKPKNNVLVLTGAGLSTASGIPDYRGHNGSYQQGHKPMIHDQFVNHASQRQRYWGRSMVGWRSFAESVPNSGHHALTTLEQMKHIGVQFPDSPTYYSPSTSSNYYLHSTGQTHLSIITQNVDGLHRKAGTKHVTELHGRGDVLKCMSCGEEYCRHEYHDLLEEVNQEWIAENLLQKKEGEEEDKRQLRPDGDGYVATQSYEKVIVPPCPSCTTQNATITTATISDNSNNNNNNNNMPTPGFLKPNVVFFGDSVPRHRVNRCYGAVQASDGLLCIGSSLAVHSAFRFVRAAAEKNIPICILNVGVTRAEGEYNDGRGVVVDERLKKRLEELVMKIEAPAGPTLSACVDMLASASSSSSI